MRFIRKGGRVIPIGEYKAQGKTVAKRGLVGYGAAVGTSIVAGGVAGHSLVKQSMHGAKALKWATNARQAKTVAAGPKFPEALPDVNFKMFKSAAHTEMKSALKYGARGAAAVKVIKGARLVGAASLGVAAFGAFKSLGIGHKKKSE